MSWNVSFGGVFLIVLVGVGMGALAQRLVRAFGIRNERGGKVVGAVVCLVAVAGLAAAPYDSSSTRSINKLAEFDSGLTVKDVLGDNPLPAARVAAAIRAACHDVSPDDTLYAGFMDTDVSTDTYTAFGWPWRLCFLGRYDYGVVAPGVSLGPGRVSVTNKYLFRVQWGTGRFPGVDRYVAINLGALSACILLGAVIFGAVRFAGGYALRGRARRRIARAECVA